MRTPLFVVALSSVLLVAQGCDDAGPPRCQSCADPASSDPFGREVEPDPCENGGCFGPGAGSGSGCDGANCAPACDERSFSTVFQAQGTFGLGHPCGQTADCEAGLECESVRNSQWRVCTRDCESAACAAGSTCVTALSARAGPGGGLVNRRLCAPSCAVDADCPQAPQSLCVPQANETVPSVCDPTPCYRDEDCAGGRSCVGAACAAPGSEAPDMPGFCDAG